MTLSTMICSKSRGFVSRLSRNCGAVIRSYSDYAGRSSRDSWYNKSQDTESDRPSKPLESEGSRRITRPSKPAIVSSEKLRVKKYNWQSYDFVDQRKSDNASEEAFHGTFAPKHKKFSKGGFGEFQRDEASQVPSHSKRANPVERNVKEYNYGLSGVGKALPERLTPTPNVKGEILYGFHSALLALTAERRHFHKIYIRDTLMQSERPIIRQLIEVAQEKSVRIEVCDKSLLTSLSQARPHQGVCLDASKLDYENMKSDFDDVDDSSLSNRPRLFVILDSIQDPMNLGAVIRSAYFLGVDQLFVVKENSCSLTPVVSKSSAGIMEITKIFAIPHLAEFLEDYKERGWNLLGTTGSSDSNPSKTIPLNTVTLEQNTILILGNEGSGLTRETEDLCHQLVTISPGRQMHPLVDSLNVSVASGIMLHHLCRSRTADQT